MLIYLMFWKNFLLDKLYPLEKSIGGISTKNIICEFIWTEIYVIKKYNAPTDIPNKIAILVWLTKCQCFVYINPLSNTYIDNIALKISITIPGLPIYPIVL